MRTAIALTNYLLLHDDGGIHYPMSKFLSDKFDNPNTRELVSQSLRIFVRFLTAHHIELTVRALEGRCLSFDECKSLAGLCYRPLAEAELLSDTKVVLLTSAKTGKAPQVRTNAVEPNTALKRLNHIASYLSFYYEVFLDPHSQSGALRTELSESYKKTRDQLIGEIGGTKQNHHLMIQSLPSDRFLQLIRDIVLRPHLWFVTPSGKTSATLYRDRAMVLLACEGLRPGSIGNIIREDFRENGGYLVVKDNRKRRLGRPSSGTPLLKLGASTSVNSAAETMISLQPFTIQAIHDYIRRERVPILAKHVQNRSRGFLFLNERGEPIGHRSSITAIFNRLGKQLEKAGMLDVGSDPYFRSKLQYDFYSYVLRHSAASLYVEMNGSDDRVLDSMKLRFGWTVNSTQPQRYASRALSDKANIDLMVFYQAILDDMAKKVEA